MIMPDVNLLLYAYDTSSEFHKRSAAWLEEILSTEEVFFSWHTLTAFIRITTHPTAMKNPMILVKAIGIVSSWLQLENTHVVGLAKKNWELYSSTLVEGQATGNLVMDAHLAALATTCGAVIATVDKDFARFSRVRTVNPIEV